MSEPSPPPRPTPPPPPPSRSARANLHPERSYIGPAPDSLPPPRTRSQADKYFARVANENIPPSRYMKALSIGGWVLGGISVVYMALIVDFGDREHVFSPLRRQFRSWTKDFITLSPTERSMMGLDRPLKKDQEERERQQQQQQQRPS